MRAALLVALGAVAVLAGCSLEPAYQRPASGIGQSWPSGAAYSVAEPKPATQTPAADIGWHEFFSDPQLRNLISIALENNRNLRIAALKVEQSQAQYRVQRGGLFPSISADGSDTVQHVASGVHSPGGGAGGGGTFRTFAAGIGFTSYEIDFFGRIRSLNHAALQRYFSQIATRKSAQISLVAEVANDYLSYLSDHSLLTLAKDTYANQQTAYTLTKKSFDAGVNTGLDLDQAQQAVATAQADIAKFTRLVAQDRNALQSVLGTALPAGLSGSTGLDGEHFLESLPAGLPSDLLNRRPDILAAEHQLEAANADIGAARAAFFPSISLTGSFGTASSALSGLFGNGSEQWTFAPTISVPIFAGGTNFANLDLAKIEKNIAVAQYQQSIQTAFREVADALAARGTLDDQIGAEQRLTQAAKNSYDLARMRFRQGVDSYLAVLDSQRSWYQAQQTLISTRLARLQNLVTLYKALGGGWNAQTVDNAVHPQTARRDRGAME